MAFVFFDSSPIHEQMKERIQLTHHTARKLKQSATSVFFMWVPTLLRVLLYADVLAQHSMQA